MTTTQITAVGQYQACAYRIWRLADDCAIAKDGGGVAQAIVGTGVIRANMTVEMKEGQEVEANTACGSLAWSARDVDRIKRWNLEFEVATWDYEALGMMVGGYLLSGNGATEASWNTKTIGWAAPGPTSNNQPAVALELWSRAAYSTGACASVAGAPPKYIRHIFPRATLQLADRAFEEATPAYMKFTGRAEANPSFLADIASSFTQNDIEAADTPWIGPASTTSFASATYVQMFGQGLPVQATGKDFDGGYTGYTFD